MRIADPIGTGMNIKRLKEEHDLTVEVIRDALGFTTPQAIYKWMRGDGMPSVDSLIVLADLFGCRIDDIVATTTDTPLGALYQKFYAKYSEYLKKEEVVDDNNN